MGGMGGMGGGGNQHFSHMGGGGNQNFSHMGGGGPASPQWKTTLCKNYQEDGRFVRVIYAVLAMRTHIWDLVSTGTRLLKRSQKVPIIAHKTQISVALCFRTREDIKYVTFYPFHNFLKCKVRVRSAVSVCSWSARIANVSSELFAAEPTGSFH